MTRIYTGVLAQQELHSQDERVESGSKVPGGFSLEYTGGAPGGDSKRFVVPTDARGVHGIDAGLISLSTCATRCIEAPSCRGIFYSSTDGRCFLLQKILETSTLAEGRSFLKTACDYNRRFNPSYYAHAYSDARQMCGTNAIKLAAHWQQYGKKESRIGCTGCCPGWALVSSQRSCLSLKWSMPTPESLVCGSTPQPEESCPGALTFDEAQDMCLQVCASRAMHGC